MRYLQVLQAPRRRKRSRLRLRQRMWSESDEKLPPRTTVGIIRQLAGMTAAVVPIAMTLLQPAMTVQVTGRTEMADIQAIVVGTAMAQTISVIERMAPLTAETATARIIMEAAQIGTAATATTGGTRIVTTTGTAGTTVAPPRITIGTTRGIVPLPDIAPSNEGAPHEEMPIAVIGIRHYLFA
jgi:hypothetical protein